MPTCCWPCLVTMILWIVVFAFCWTLFHWFINVITKNSLLQVILINASGLVLNFSGLNIFLNLHMHHIHHPILPILERFRNLMSDFLRNKIHNPSCPLVHFQIDCVLQNTSCNCNLLGTWFCVDGDLTWCMWWTKHFRLHQCVFFFDFSRYHAWFCIPLDNLDRTLHDKSRSAQTW